MPISATPTGNSSPPGYKLSLGPSAIKMMCKSATTDRNTIVAHRLVMPETDFPTNVVTNTPRNTSLPLPGVIVSFALIAVTRLAAMQINAQTKEIGFASLDSLTSCHPSSHYRQSYYKHHTRHHRLLAPAQRQEGSLPNPWPRPSVRQLPIHNVQTHRL